MSALPAAPSVSSAAPTAVAGTAPLPRDRLVRDRGSVRREEVRAGRWVAEGTVKVTRDVDAESAELQGLVSVGGRLTVGSVRARGTLEVEGAVELREHGRLQGDVRLAGPVHAAELELDGVGRLSGSLTVERTLTARGTLHAPSVTAGVVEVGGAVHIPGEVRALSATFHLTRSSDLGLVRARTVLVHARPPSLVDKVFFRDPTYRIDRIEADAVDLRGVDVGFVRGKSIVLGRDVHVTEAEGTIVRQHPSSLVGPESKSPPPYGLRR